MNLDYDYTKELTASLVREYLSRKVSSTNANVLYVLEFVNFAHGPRELEVEFN